MASTKIRMMTGIFQFKSLLNFEPQFQQTGSWVGTMRLHLGHGRRGAVVSRPHQLQSCVLVVPPQKGHTTGPEPKGPGAPGGGYC
ncbi:MAG: hypothetical protein QOH25_1151 [Acidobacteriota bacterium]|jgi:hypothetical protein|nr:hypothetical protein [Acidobacteriota bacterium]